MHNNDDTRENHQNRRSILHFSRYALNQENEKRKKNVSELVLGLVHSLEFLIEIVVVVFLLVAYRFFLIFSQALLLN